MNPHVIEALRAPDHPAAKNLIHAEAENIWAQPTTEPPVDDVVEDTVTTWDMIIFTVLLVAGSICFLGVAIRLIWQVITWLL